MQRALNIDDLGDYRVQVHEYFTAAFGFTWAWGDNEIGDPDERSRLIVAVQQAKSGPSANYREEQLLLAELYALHQRLSDYFAQADPRWDARVAALRALSAEAGRWLSYLKLALGDSGAHFSAFHETVSGLFSRWVDIELDIEDIHAVALTDRGMERSDDLARLVPEVQAIGLELGTLPALITDAEAERWIDGARPDLCALLAALVRARDGVAALDTGLQDAIRVVSPATAPTLHGRALDQYFARIRDVLPVIETWYYDASVPAGARCPIRTQYEVPQEYLTVYPDDDDRREAFLCSLATFRAEFVEHLPSVCRRDRQSPPNTGGSGNRNPVLAGIGAAMIFAEQLMQQPGDEVLPGDDLFDKVVTRTRQMLVRAGERGRLAVDPAGAWSSSAGTSVGGQPRPYIRPRLVEFRPTTVERIEQRRIAKEEV